MSKAATTATASSTNASASNGTIVSSSGAVFKKPERAGNNGDIKYVRLGQLKAGDIVVEGIFTGTSQNATYPEKLDFLFSDANGNKIVVNEGGNLKFRMKDIAAGTLVMITYEGMQTIAKGPRKGKLSHQVEVLIAD